MPALEQIGGIEFRLLAAGCVLLIFAAQAGAQAFENLAFAMRLAVLAERFLAGRFMLLKFALELPAQALQVLAKDRSKLEFGSSASGLEIGRIGPIRFDKEVFQLKQRLLRAGDMEVGLLELKHALALDALTKAQQRGESEAERHD